MSPPPTGTGWSDDDREEALKLWNDGLSANEIKDRFPGRTRNSIIGIITRAGMTRGPAASNSIRLARANYKAASKRPKRTYIRPQAKAFGETKVKPAGIKPMSWGSAVPISNPEERPAPMRERAETWQPLPGVIPVSILDLTHMHCRWPLDLAGVDLPHACGALPIGGRYCIVHSARSKSQVAASTPKELVRSLRRYAA